MGENLRGGNPFLEQHTVNHHSTGIVHKPTLTPQPCRDAYRPAVCTCSSRLRTSEKILLSPHTMRITGCGKELLPTPKMGCGDPLTDYFLPGSHRLAAELKGSKWKRAAAYALSTLGKHAEPRAAPVAEDHLKSSNFQEARKKKRLRKENFQTLGARGSPGLSEQCSQVTNVSIPFALLPSSHSCPRSCFAMVEASRRKPLFPSSEHQESPTFWTWRALWSRDHTTSQSTWPKGLSITSQTLCCVPHT